jgi:hypothetical protein
MEHTPENYYNRALKLHQEGYPVKTIQMMLQKEGLKEEMLVEALCRIKLLVYKKRKNKGVSLMIGGGLLLLFGFVSTVFLFHANHSFDMIMYGFTIVGTILMGWGTYEILQ